jgi:hypothetical protein
VNVHDVAERLRRGEIVACSTSEWEQLAAIVETVEEHDTKLSGLLLIIRFGDVTAAVEEPSADERVIRPLADMTAARGFVEDRLDTYERMWDGCGCKVDYYR